MRIASFNLENLSGSSEGDEALDAKCEILRPQLNRLDADILCLQEVGAEHVGKKDTPRQLRALSVLLEGTRYADYHMAHSTTKEGAQLLDIHNLVTLSRYPIVRRHQLWNDLVESPRYRIKTADPNPLVSENINWDRPVLHTEIELGNDQILNVFNLHLRAPLSSYIPGQKLGPFKWRTTAGWAEGFFIAAVKRSGQALEVRFAIDNLFDNRPDALIAVCGDMNAEEHEMPLRILHADQSETENPDLKSRMMIPMSQVAPEDRRFSVIHDGRPIMLDHMLVSRALFDHFQKIQIHNDFLTDEVTDYRRGENLLASHHAPLVASFDIINSSNR